MGKWKIAGHEGVTQRKIFSRESAFVSCGSRNRIHVGSKLGQYLRAIYSRFHGNWCNFLGMYSLIAKKNRSRQLSRCTENFLQALLSEGVVSRYTVVRKFLVELPPWRRSVIRWQNFICNEWGTFVFHIFDLLYEDAWAIARCASLSLVRTYVTYVFELYQKWDLLLASSVRLSWFLCGKSRPVLEIIFICVTNYGILMMSASDIFQSITLAATL